MSAKAKRSETVVRLQRDSKSVSVLTDLARRSDQKDLQGRAERDFFIHLAKFDRRK